MTPAQASPAPARIPREKIVDFVPELLAAPFFLRCAALSIDYIFLLTLPVIALLWNKVYGDGVTYTGPGSGVWILSVILWAADFLLLPLLRGQSLGKFLTGITIVNADGSRIGLVTVLRRNLLGYAITAVTLGIGFLSTVFSRKGRALHDIVAGTVVVRGKLKQI